MSFRHAVSTLRCLFRLARVFISSALGARRLLLRRAACGTPLRRRLGPPEQFAIALGSHKPPSWSWDSKPVNCGQDEISEASRENVGVRAHLAIFTEELVFILSIGGICTVEVRRVCAGVEERGAGKVGRRALVRAGNGRRGVRDDQTKSHGDKESGEYAQHGFDREGERWKDFWTCATCQSLIR
jgi:hypothetical protein